MYTVGISVFVRVSLLVYNYYYSGHILMLITNGNKNNNEEQYQELPLDKLCQHYQQCQYHIAREFSQSNIFVKKLKGKILPQKIFTSGPCCPERLLRQRNILQKKLANQLIHKILKNFPPQKICTIWQLPCEYKLCTACMVKHLVVFVWACEH